MRFSCIAAVLAAAGTAHAFVVGGGLKVVQRAAHTTRMLAVGEIAPDFSLKNQDGKTVKLSQFKGKKSVVVFFYPKDETPGCTKEACAFNDNMSQFGKLGAEVLGVSSDADHTPFANKYGLGMSLLSDIGGKVRKEWKVPAALFGALDGRVTYVIDKTGVVKAIHDNAFAPESHVAVAIKSLVG